MRRSYLTFLAFAAIFVLASPHAASAGGLDSLWGGAPLSNFTPFSDSAAELGTRFQSNVSGYIAGIQFYKNSSDTSGTHTCNLWDSNGNLLATATTSNESASGWQSVNFPTPYLIQAGTTYVASYYSSAGYYIATGSYFNSAGTPAQGGDPSTPPYSGYGNNLSGQLQTLSSPLGTLTSGGNGIYTYGSTSTFPFNSFNATNYWVDVLFDSNVLNGTGNTIAPTATQSFSGTVATFTDSNIASTDADFTATIDWGDGTGPDPTAVVTGGNGNFIVNGTHTYAAQGNYNVVATLTENAPGVATAQASGTANVSSNTVLTASGATITAVESLNFSGTTATFTDTNSADAASAFTATIDWGDGTGTDTTAVVTGGSGSFSVLGSHIYAQEGSYNTTVSIAMISPGTATAQAFGAANVNPAALSATVTNPTTVEGAAFSGVVATFTDAGSVDGASAFTVTIDWGDGAGPDTTSETITGSGGNFSVQGVHTYAEEGAYPITITIQDSGGASTTANGSVTVSDGSLSAIGTVLAPIQGQNFTGTVAVFTDSNPNAPLSDFIASINWGDGVTSSGTLLSASGGFDVVGTHTYATYGSFPVSITISDIGGSQATANSTANVTAVTLSGLTLNAASVTGGAAVTGTLTLNYPAPAGGITVNLTSDTPTAASVPASVTVAAGATAATFKVTTTAVTTDANVTISGSYNGTTQSAPLQVLAPALTSITLSSASVIGGAKPTGTVNLSGPAPSGGIVVSLASNNAAATVPTNVTVIAGAKSAKFTVVTSAVSTNTSGTISGSYNGTTQSAPLQVLASAPTSLTLSSKSVIGGAKPTGTVNLSGPAPSGGIVISLASNNAAATVPTNVTVTAGAKSAKFIITTSAVTSSASGTITAVYAGVTINSPTLTVLPPVLSKLTLSATSVTAGSSVSGTVTLSGPAPSGGIVVSLASDNTAVAQPVDAHGNPLLSITVPAGKTTSAKFSVKTYSPGTANISGAYNGTKSAPLTVN